ncbi:MAG TPA: hypothetical protein DCF68_12980 [Cyanothece sp. UBA12306]|nr:hypothetical protein [Cyanothece sp. UBA12306]
MLETLIKYFVYGTKGHITKTQLINFLYLADLYSVKWTAKQLTDLDWFYDHNNLKNEKIDEILNKLNNQEIMQELQNNTILIRLGNKPGTIEDLDLSLSLKLILDNIRREWAGSGKERLQNLLEYVKNTAPIMEVKNMDTNQTQRQLNLHQERERLLNELEF